MFCLQFCVIAIGRQFDKQGIILISKSMQGLFARKKELPKYNFPTFKSWSTGPSKLLEAWYKNLDNF